MSYIEDIEQAIADRLSPFGTAGFTVRVLPENQSEYGEKVFLNGEITVAYHSSKFDERNDIGLGSSQYEDITFILAIRSRKLRGAKGVYNIASIIRRYLVGFKPANYWPIKAVEMGLKDATREDQLWTYYATYQTRAIAVEDLEIGTEAALAKILFDDLLTGEQGEVPRPPIE